MEKSNPFPTGFGFGRKPIKAEALIYELNINNITKDCKEFNTFILLYCSISIIAQITRFVFDEKDIYICFLGSFGLCIWIFGLIVFIRCRDGYTSRKSNHIELNCFYLVIFLIAQCIYLTIATIKVYLVSDYDYSSSNASKYVWYTIFLFIAFIFYMSWYTLSLNLNLAKEIKTYNSH